MQGFFDSIASGFDLMLHTVFINDIIDIAIVAFLIYHLIKMIRDTNAETLVKGILIFALVALAANLFGLKTLKYIVSNLFEVGLFAIIVLFQPELRKALEQIGRTRIGKFSLLGTGATTEEKAGKIRTAIREVCGAVTILQRQRMGALIVFERETKLGHIVRTGTVIDAEPSSELIGNVFFNKAPLHDGAMIIRDGKVHAAACILPLSQNHDISTELGTRHRAALGMSENSDALVVVVSEETGSISVAINGILQRNISVETLKSVLEEGLIGRADDASGDKPSFWRVKSK